ncbi:hypothetical protein J4410_05350 [Candidatus Woesearchaeota archaeon]|nr:hypothetical protein [Candidatus Woesearchaeota archaeon]
MKMKTQWKKTAVVLLVVCLSAMIVYAARLPTPGGDTDNWGEILNEYLLVSHDDQGNLKEGIITSAKIASSTITGLHMQQNAITTEHLVDGTIKNEDIAADARIAISKIEPLTWSLFQGVLSPAQGGTGTALTTFQKGDLLVGNENGGMRTLATGTGDQVLLGGATPSWGLMSSQHIASNSINSNHIIDGTIQGEDMSTSSQLVVDSLTANTLNAPLNLQIETASASCRGFGCVAKADCPSGKVIISGFKSDFYSLCDGTHYPSYCRGFCSPGTTSCSETSTSRGSASAYGASVYITCIGVSS